MNARAQARATRIAENTTSLIDYTSRILGAIEDGTWYHAWDKLHGLRRAVEALDRDLDPSKHTTELACVRAAAVWPMVCREARHYWLGQAVLSWRRSISTDRETVTATARQALADYRAPAHTVNHPHHCEQLATALEGLLEQLDQAGGQA